ncbi:MAG: DUF2656 family protein [Prochlorococcus sp.]|nr:DUF2656 family protein [Prochlorococcaceae cyanobacterium Fu_MAG_50]
MTTFILSHNLQVQSSQVPTLSAQELAAGLASHCLSLTVSEPLDHPHWMAKVESELTPQQLAAELVKGWRSLRAELGHDHQHAVMALGGRKDSEGQPGSPLQKGAWGVDVVETLDPAEFLKAINWAALKADRPVDGVFELIDQP